MAEHSEPDLTPQGRFIEAYSDMVMAVWRDDAEAARLERDPAGYALAIGLPVAEGAVVVVDRSQPSEALTQDEVLADWNRTPGRHILHVPATPIIDLSELTEDELDLVAAGVKSTKPGTTNNNNNNNGGGGGGGGTILVVIV
jgi:hypothetical protein